MKTQLKIVLPTEHDTLALGAHLAKLITNDFLIFLHGDLGVGKTTLVRGFLTLLIPDKIVKSPTYTIVESYHVHNKIIHHFDLYRIKDPEELELIGIRDYFVAKSIIFVEWPENGNPYLPICDLDCYIHEANNIREIIIISNSQKGDKLLHKLC